MIINYKDFDSDQELYTELFNKYDESDYESFMEIISHLISKKKLSSALSYLRETISDSKYDIMTDLILNYTVDMLENMK